MLKKKGRRPKSYYEALNSIDSSSNVIINNTTPDINPPEKIHKKRGRKPKGGKFVEVKNIITDSIPEPNIIIHLKCKLQNIYENTSEIIKYQPSINEINDFDQLYDNKFINYNYLHIDKNNTNNDTNSSNTNNNDTNTNINANTNINTNTNTNANTNTNNNTTNTNSNTDINYINNKTDINDINNNNLSTNFIDSEKFIKKNLSKKIKELSYNLKHNNISNKSDCFWCTFPFDNDTIYLPKYELDNKYYCYGCFCSPECACSYLMNENIDNSCKFERYYMLNNIYGKIYNYDKNIKPAPSPYYTLNKYFGNLSIQEYRTLLNNERLLLTVEKPLSQILPEIYEENDDFLLSARILSKNSYKK